MMQRRRFTTRMQSSSLSSSIHHPTDQVRLFDRFTFKWMHIFVYRYQGSEAAKQTGPKIRRFVWSSRDKRTNTVVESTEPLPRPVEDEERLFHEYFAKEVSALLQRVVGRFPYRHLIQWSMYVGNQCQHDLDIEVKPPTSCKKD
jgi:hypothetical protein